MSDSPWIVHASLDDAELTIDDLCRLCAVSPAWVHERVGAGLLAPRTAGGAPAAAWRFDAALLARVRVMRGIERDFDAVPELAALVADLQDEVRRLRRLLGHAR